MRKLMLLMLLVATPALAQTPQNDFAAGFGLDLPVVGGPTFDVSFLYTALHWNGLKLPGPSVSTGIAIEFYPGSVSADGASVTVDYRVWSLNRFDCPSMFYCGVDMQIGKGGDGGGYSMDFDQRIVTGVSLYQSAAVNVNAEFYMLGEDPVAFAVLVRWGGGERNQGGKTP